MEIVLDIKINTSQIKQYRRKTRNKILPYNNKTYYPKTLTNDNLAV